MEPNIAPMKKMYNTNLEEKIEKLLHIRNMCADEFIENYGSGTLRKNKRIGMAWKDQYLSERIAYDFGWEFSIIPRSRITTGVAMTFEDEHAVTEAGWHIERYMNLRFFPNDELSCKYIQVEEKDGTRREGIGILVEKTDAKYIPKGSVVYSIVSEYDTNLEKWIDAKNPF